MKKRQDKNNFFISLVLRAGLGFVFVYAAISAFLEPSLWIGFIPKIAGVLASREILLSMHSFFNLFLGFWLISGKKTFWAAITSCVVLGVIIVSNISIFVIVFRDVGLFMAALALALHEKNKN